MSNLKIISIKEGVANSTGNKFVAIQCVQEQFLPIVYEKDSSGKSVYARKQNLFEGLSEKEAEHFIYQQGGSFCSYFLRNEDAMLAKAFKVNETLHLKDAQFERNTQADNTFLNVRGELLLSATQTLRLFKSMQGNVTNETATEATPKTTPKPRKPKMAAASMTTEVKEESVEVAIDEKIPF